MTARILAFALCLSTLVTTAAAASPVVELRTNRGVIAIELAVDAAPASVENFLRHVDAGAYDGTIFHRVIPGFMVQGGGFDADFKERTAGTPIRNEAGNGLPNVRGTVAMARTSDPHSARMQFFVNVADNDFLNHTSETPRGWGYAVFGKVVDGMDVVDAIAALPTGSAGPFAEDAPLQPVIIQRAVRRPQESPDAGTP